MSFTARAKYNGSFKATTLLTYLPDGATSASFARAEATLNPDDGLAVLEVATDPKKPAVKEPFLLRVKVKNTGKTAVNTIRPSIELVPSTLIAAGRDIDSPETVRLGPGADEQFLRDKVLELDGTEATLRRVARNTRNELKQSLKARETTKVKINSKKFGDTVSFRNGDQWVVSDLDGQYFMPADGVWPTGLKAQMETEINALAKQYVERWPDHGWSNTASDLQGWLGDKLFDCQLSLVAPRDLPDAIRRTLQRLPEIARRKRLKAATLGKSAFAKKLLAQADELDKTTYDTLFKQFKDKTEKIIVITTGDVRVGFNPAIKPVGP